MSRGRNGRKNLKETSVNSSSRICSLNWKMDRDIITIILLFSLLVLLLLLFFVQGRNTESTVKREQSITII